MSTAKEEFTGYRYWRTPEGVWRSQQTAASYLAIIEGIDGSIDLDLSVLPRQQRKIVKLAERYIVRVTNEPSRLGEVFLQINKDSRKIRIIIVYPSERYELVFENQIANDYASIKSTREYKVAVNALNKAERIYALQKTLETEWNIAEESIGEQTKASSSSTSTSVGHSKRDREHEEQLHTKAPKTADHKHKPRIVFRKFKEGERVLTTDNRTGVIVKISKESTLQFPEQYEIFLEGAPRTSFIMRDDILGVLDQTTH